MEKTKKSFYKIFSLVLVALVIFAGYFFYQSKSQPTKKSTIQQNLSVYLKLAGEENFSKSEVVVGKTVLDLTKEKANIKTKGEGANTYVTEINGREALNSKKEYWAFYVNGKMAEVGAGSYKLKNKDKIEWKIEKY
ncbi:MAG: DUF4430 domain-containing protein [Candidatus Roizmanbacteria bacterium]|nr:DUF4430 domain-containing protein [Candidatus Roizmanbacteria bacterium]